jgi:DNA mismatch repair protein MutL
LLLTGRYPIAMLRIEMPAEMIDVNVHPTKLEVRFQDSGRLYSQLLGTLRTKFLSTDLTARLQPVGAGASSAVESGTQGIRSSAPGTPGYDEFATHNDRAEQVRRELVGWAKGELERSVNERGGAPSMASAATTAAAAMVAQPALGFDVGAKRTTVSSGGLDLVRLDRGWRPVGQFADDEPEPEFEMPEAGGSAQRADAFLRIDRGAANGTPSQGAVSSPGAEQNHVPEYRGDYRADVGGGALQVHNRYLVAETEEGLLVVDQHALHERILYEQLREKVLSGALESQRLLVPEPVDLTPAEKAAVLDARDDLAKLGVTVEPFGGDTVIVASYPAMLANFGPAQVLRDLVDLLLAGGKAPERRDLIDDLLHMISCKAAIKAGDRLNSHEITALLEQRHLAQDTHHCPHGRPTALVFTREELDKQFKRI